MALVSGGFRGSVTLVDNGRNTTTKQYELKATTLAAAVTDMADIVTALDAVTNAVIVSYNVSQVFVEDALALPAAGVQIEEQALITTTIVGDPLKSASFTIPAPVAAIFVGTSGENADIVNTENALFDAYFSVFQLNGQAYISDGESALAAKKGRRIHKASRRG